MGKCLTGCYYNLYVKGSTMNLVVLPQDPRSLGINSVYTDLRMFLCSALNRFSGYEDHGCGQRQGGNRGVEAN